MSIDSIGSGNTSATPTFLSTSAQAQLQQRKVDTKSPSAPASEEIADVVKITFPPFIPAGHTQTIFKEQK